MNKFLNIVILLITFSLTACSNTPNSVTMTVAQGQCVQTSQYRGVTPNFQNLIESNPTTTTPYCLAVTVQNNNTGLNANNVQITSSGLQVSYLNFSSNSESTAQLFDSAAAGVTVSTATQTVNNLILFDPYNCVTTSGAQVLVLGMGGGTCTFYLQESGESSPVGVFPYSLTYNYTNGNANYSVTSTFNQRTTLYGGTNIGLYSVTANIVNNTLNPFTNQIQWQPVSSATGMPPTLGLTRSAYGIVYFAESNTVYQYNGLTITQVGNSLPLPSLPYIINNLALDTNGNLFAGTNGNGLFVNQFANESTWTQVITNGITNSSNNIIGLKSTTSSGNPLLYVIESANGYICTYTNDSSNINCLIIPPIAGGGGNPVFLQNALDVDSSGNLYFGGLLNGNLNIYNWASSLSPYSPDIPQTNSTIGAVLYNLFNTESSIYFSLSTNESNENLVYSCIQSSCNPVVSESGNPLGTSPLRASGYVNSLTNDGYGNLYASGFTLYSADWASNESSFPISAALLFGNSVTYGGGNWIPIFPATSQQKILSTVVATTLTSY
ncbi:MAG: hypothetical protein ORN24_03600 [Burkholderiales bacterium]|nr:hypothetical protein [Burkholderiales bacterium]